MGQTWKLNSFIITLLCAIIVSIQTINKVQIMKVLFSFKYNNSVNDKKIVILLFIIWYGYCIKTCYLILCIIY